MFDRLREQSASGRFRRGGGRSCRSLPVLRRSLRSACAAVPALALGAPAHAQDAFIRGGPEAILSPADVAQLSLFMGTVLGGAFFAYRLMQERRRLAEECNALRGRVTSVTRDNARLTTLADARDRRIVMWPSDADKDGRPALFGELPAETGAPPDRATFLGFGRWLRPHSAGLLEHAIAELRGDGAPFDLTVETAAGVPLEVEGRTGANGRFVRFLPTHASRRAETDLRARAERLEAQLDRVQALTADVSHPSWTRDPDGRLDSVNMAYARAKGFDSAQDALGNGAELFGEVARNAMAESLDGPTATFNGRLTTTIHGERRVFQVHEVRTAVGTAGVAVDITEADDAEQTLARTRRAHAEALDNLATAVASFDAETKLVHWNAAFEKLWDFERSFLEGRPSNAALLERLRAQGKLAETPRWREWVNETLAAYDAVEPHETQWMPPDGRTIHVVAAPQEGGGVMWLFENMTERHALASRATESLRLLDASLKHLEEGLAVFGPDGRLRLANPAFAEMWRLDGTTSKEGTHVSAVAAACADRFEAPSTLWIDMVEEVTAFSDKRGPRAGQVRLNGGLTLAWTSQPLPRGETLLSFVDMSDTVRVADALQARNEAMERADSLKTAFLGHVSYELRSPLTSIIGFTELLVSGAAGAMTDRQAHYVGFIDNSSKELIKTIDQIIDLSAIDAGELRLDRETVVLDELLAGAIKRIEPVLAEDNLLLEVEEPEEDIGSIEGDRSRLSQIVDYLLMNAVEQTPRGGTLTLTIDRDGTAGDVRLSVADQSGADAGRIDERVLEPFAQGDGKGRRKDGLALATVKAFTQLHGGRVEVAPSEKGSTITCIIPPDGGGKNGPDKPTGPILRAAPVSDQLPGGRARNGAPDPVKRDAEQRSASA